MKKYPFANTSYNEIVDQNYIYVDKTKYIEILEEQNCKTPLFLRPRRFGKSLFTKTLESYYDLNQANTFERYFGNTYIGSHPTPKRNSYYILRLDFSGIETHDYIEKSFTTKLAKAILDFSNNYPAFKMDLNLDQESAVLLLQRFMLNFAQKRNNPQEQILLIIDEYDNFANIILAENLAKFTEITSQDGFLKSFFALLKAQFDDLQPVFAKVYMTGVMSVTISAITSGYNAVNISDSIEFQGLAGFDEEELRAVINDTVDFSQSSYTVDQIIKIMKDHFNGYRFALGVSEQKSLFNSTLCLNFLKRFQANNYKAFDLSPDPDVDVDLTKLEEYLKLIQPLDLKSIIDEILRNQVLKGRLLENLNINSRKFSRDEGLSFLFYLGFLTLADENSIKADYGEQYLNTGFKYFKVPNHYFYSLFMNYISKKMIGDNVTNNVEITNMLYQNDLSNFKEALQQKLDALPDFGKIHDNERVLAILAYTVITEAMLDSMFDFYWEYAVTYDDGIEKRRGRIDMLLVNKGTNPSYMFEFKFLKEHFNSKDQTKGKKIEEVKEQARSQLNDYATDVRIKNISNLHKYMVIYAYDQLEIEEII